MSDYLLLQILEEVKEMKTIQQEMNAHLNSIKALAYDIPLIKQAVLETREDLKQLENFS
ncbi:hypothetical protein [Paenibacillus sp. Soil750]|uniref:hypothetical protein n=1 Tax=Paenibacillus sp. Soil750 TaxID=1736398 RepID=UPI000AB769F0|nr:hypothetical protein [Paenibacillus sp. Soil750]